MHIECVRSASVFSFEKLNISLAEKKNICSVIILRYLSRIKHDSCLTQTSRRCKVWKMITFTLPVLVVRTSDCLI